MQQCIIHLIRNTFRYVSKKYWGAISSDLKPVYTAASEPEARVRMEEFCEKWGTPYPAIKNLWETAWPEFVPFLDYDVEIRRVVCSTDENVQPPTGSTGTACWEHPAAAAGERRPAAAVKVERPVGRTTLTAARTGVGWSAVGAVDRRSEEHGLGLEAVPRCLAPSA